MPELCGIDPGSTNIDQFDETMRCFVTDDRVYTNSHATLIAFARRFKALGVKPALACWSIPFVRSATTLLDMGLIDDPAYFFFVCSGCAPITPPPLHTKKK